MTFQSPRKTEKLSQYISSGMKYQDTCTDNKQLSLRILFFEEGEFGGSVRSLGQLIKGLSALGSKVGLVSHYRKTGPEDVGSMEEVSFWRCLDLPPQIRPRPEVAVRTFGIPHPTLFGMKYFFTALRALLSFRPNIAYFNSEIESSIPGAIAAKLLGVSTICHLRMARDLHSIEKKAIKLFDHFIALSKAGQDIAQANGIPEKKLTQLYNPLDILTFDKQTGETLSLDMPWDNDCIYVIQVGALNDRKRPKLALDALSFSLKQCPKLRLIFAGSGPLREKLEQEIIRRGLTDYVYLVGDCFQIPALLNRCHIGLLVSAQEGLARVILEYMCAGLPVVTWNMPGAEELVQDGQTGIMVQQDDAESFGEVLIKLCKSSKLREQMGQAGQEWVAQGQFDLSRYMQRLYDLLVNVAKNTV